MARVARMALDVAIAACKTIKPEVAIAWQYWKVEVVPPMTTAFFAGPVGKQMEASCGRFMDGIIGTMVKAVQAMDAAEARRKQAKIDAIKAAEAKAKAKALEEAKKREAEDKKKAAEKAAGDKKAAEAKKSKEAAEAKKSEAKAKEKPPAKAEKKAEPKPKPPKQDPPKKK